MKLKLSELKVENMSGGGNCKKGYCPECNRYTLSVNTATKVFKCFHTGCNFAGQIVGEDEESDGQKKAAGQDEPTAYYNEEGAPLTVEALALEEEEEEGGQQPSVPDRYISDIKDIRIYPHDYKRLENSELKGMRLLTDDLTTQDEVQRQAQRYLQDQGIALSVAVSERMVCGWHNFTIETDEVDAKTQQPGHQSLPQRCIGYVNFVEDRPVNVKFRSIELLEAQPVDPALPRRYRKDFTQAVHTTRPLAPYGIDSLRGREVRELCICEGEKDRLALLSAGLSPVISVADGAMEDPRPALDIFAPWLRQVERVVIFWDDDPPGRLLRERLKFYFGARSWQTRLPAGCKDAADVLREFGAEMLQDCAAQARRCLSADIREPQDDADETWRYLSGDYDHGFDLGFGPITNRHLRYCREGSLTIVTGVPGSGKSDFLSDWTSRMISGQSEGGPYNVAMLSFESPNKAKLNARLIRSVLGVSDVSRFASEEQKRQCMDMLQQHLRHVDFRRHAPSARDIIARLDELEQRGFHVDMVIIDPYSRMDLQMNARTNETQAIQRMLTDIQNWAQLHHVMTHLVAHPRKLGLVSNKAGEAEMEEINPYSISGSANWANFADYILSFRRVTKQDEDTETELDYKIMTVLKIRDQDLCVLGRVFYSRDKAGRYHEFETEQEVVEYGRV